MAVETRLGARPVPLSPAVFACNASSIVLVQCSLSAWEPDLVAMVQGGSGGSGGPGGAGGSGPSAGGGGAGVCRCLHLVLSRDI